MLPFALLNVHMNQVIAKLIFEKSYHCIVTVRALFRCQMKQHTHFKTPGMVLYTMTFMVDVRKFRFLKSAH